MANRAARAPGDSLPPLKENGVSHIAAAAKGGVSLQSKQITQSGAAPFSVVLEDHGLSKMADANYAVIVQGETVARATVDQSTITASGFDVLGGADTEVLHIVIVGRLDGMSPDVSDL